MLVSTTSNLEGYTITEYLGIVCGVADYVADSPYSGGEALMQRKLYEKAVERAFSSMTENARKVRADAVIGIIPCPAVHGEMGTVTIAMQGTAVKIRKKNSCETA